MPNTYTLIEKITVGAAGASSVTFTSIPQTYTDLKIVASVRSNRTGAINSFMRLYPNGNSTGITYRALFGTGSAASSFTQSTASEYVGEINATDSTSSTFSNTEIYIPNYTSGAQKSYSIDFVIENNATLAYMGLIGELWANTSAITSIQLLDGLANFVQYSTFYLYGIAKEGVSPSPSSAPYATGGDSIVFDGTYWIHTFTSSGTFTPRKALSNVDYLVVAGGGGAGSGAGGGGGAGGAGGLRSTVSPTGGGGSVETKITMNNGTAYTVTVGAAGGGGAGGDPGQNGSNSSISGSGLTTITSTGGGGGGSTNAGGINGFTGGSGGGGGKTSNGTGGAGTANQGYAGGAGNASFGGGGGGAGGAGGTPTAGAGVSNSISGTATTYAVGGIGRDGGAGSTVVGAGGSYDSLPTGQRGIVIIRYAA